MWVLLIRSFIIEFNKRKFPNGIGEGNLYNFISTTTLVNAKYTTSEMRDKAAFMKAKQLVNTLMNGSTITSDQIIRTDESDKRTAITSTEIVKEQSMGFIQGFELLFGKEITQDKTSYLFYLKF
jgi:hypothetical protein